MLEILEKTRFQSINFQIPRKEVEFTSDIIQTLCHFYDISPEGSFRWLKEEDSDSRTNHINKVDHLYQVMFEVLYKPIPLPKFIVVGISGPTRSGKSTLCHHLGIKFNARIF